MEQYRKHFGNKRFIVSLVIGFLILAVSLVINFYAGTYATEKASSPVNDLILDNIPVFDVDAVFVYGAIVSLAFLCALCATRLRYAPFVLKSVGTFILIRSLFITLTHLGINPQHAPIEVVNLLKDLTFGGDLFFSGHTGLPYLIALIFWDDKLVRYISLAVSVTFGVTVLMGHLHYSIDVFAAFFITFSIFHIAKKFFREDYLLTQASTDATIFKTYEAPSVTSFLPKQP